MISIIWKLLLLAVLIAEGCGKEKDLYEILGVKRTATSKEIKKAYRRKALDTHPDRRQDLSPEEAAASFHEVVHAFEILSDEQSRKRYDRTGSTKNTHSFGGGGYQDWGSANFMRFFHRGRSRRLKDQFDVQKAQSRVMHVVSLDQLRTVMLDDDDKLERNLLMCFVTPQEVEKVADDRIVYPYPFADMSPQGIWWEDLLQTVKIRFNKGNKLTRFFGVPEGDEMRKTGKPLFLFGKRGQPLSIEFARIETDDRQTFESWVWKQLSLNVEFINQHTHPVELYWIHGNRANMKKTLEPGEHGVHTTMLGHEWWARDARVDTRHDSPGRYRLTSQSGLGSWKILSDEDGQQIFIKSKSCFDMSGHCVFWKSLGECKKNPVFMNDVCKVSCDICDDGNDKTGDEL